MARRRSGDRSVRPIAARVAYAPRVTAIAVPSDAARLIRRYYVYAGIYTLAASVIWGINTLFLLDAGLSITEVFIANSAFSVGTMLFEIPTGVVADTLGRRISYLASVAILAATTVAYLLAAEAKSGLIVFGLVSVVMGLGFTFYSGALEAWLVDALAATGYRQNLDHVFARGQQINGGAMLVGTIIGERSRPRSARLPGNSVRTMGMAARRPMAVAQIMTLEATLKLVMVGVIQSARLK